MLRLPILLGSAAVLALVSTNLAQAPQGDLAVSFTAGARDDAGRFMGGTEMRVLAAHAGKLYAGNGYWEDEAGPEGPQGVEILVLDEPGARWRIDHAFDERMPDGRPRDLAVSALEEVTFTTDGKGARLPAPVSLLIAANWNLTGTTRVFSRDDAAGAWAAASLAQDRPMPGFLPQVRSLGGHRDRVTGIDLVFAGQDPRGIFGGTYDPTVPSRVRWAAAPELDLSGVSAAGLSGRNGHLRVSSFAECNGRLYAAVGQQIYERVDGAEPHWRLIYTNPYPGHSETGLRGLTAIASPSGQGQVLLAAVEGSAARLVRVDPHDGNEVTELDLAGFLANAWGMRVSYVIAAYNDMAKIRDLDGGEALLIGLEAFIPPSSPVAAGHSIVNVGYGRLEAGGWYLVRRAPGRYDLRQVMAPSGKPLVATRSIRVSPFARGDDAVYFAGYDANKVPTHDTAWIFRSTVAAATGRRVSRSRPSSADLTHANMPLSWNRSVEGEGR
jgi:hypothetical protein